MYATIHVFAPHYSTKSITIFKPSNLAEVIRSFTVELKPGRTQVEIVGLSSKLDADSVIVTGVESRANNPLRLDDVVASIARTDPVVPEIQQPGTSFEAWTSLPKSVIPERVASFLSSPGETGRKGLEVAKVGVSESERAGNSGKEVRKIELKLTYIVPNVWWEPIYELHAHTMSDTGELSTDMTLHVRARISQSTGEDWASAPLKPSTTSLADRNVSSIPSLTRVTLIPSLEMPTPPSIPPISAPTTNTVTTQPTTRSPKPPSSPAVQLSASTPVFGQPGKLGSGYKALPKVSIPISGGFSAYASDKAASFAPPAGSVNVFRSMSTSLSDAKPSPTTESTSHGLPSTSSSFFHPSPASKTVSTGGQSASVLEPDVTAKFRGQKISFPPPVLPQLLAPAIPASAAAATPSVLSSSVVAPIQTSATSTPSSVLYSVGTPVDILSDGLKHNVRIAELQFGDADVTIDHVVVPRKDSTVFRQCRITNSSEYHLLPGPVSVIINDTLVARTNIKRVNPNDTFICTLGSDSNVSLTYSRSSRTVTPSSGSPKATVYTNTISLVNRNSFDLRRVNVRDAVPIWQPSNKADEDRFRVVLRKPAELDAAAVNEAGAKNEEGQERKNVRVAWEDRANGLFAWTVDVPGGETERLELKWEVEAGQCGDGGDSCQWKGLLTSLS
ncbi:hypothetical protein GYMLUDRAFT_265767 [Collybiopsis luxurians FD-317 M1]|uniref:DUF4139 domain-containing protein n=1 Tax=Collybiopsis luxurians FD-317 M1 TaxID=944289 RepID=A0A0D0BPV8_9AGAR|nr:hypothetical protein GYMLUDRAFT_265767 [Collybiopsis luxurians FD-317 M1]